MPDVGGQPDEGVSVSPLRARVQSEGQDGLPPRVPRSAQPLPNWLVQLVLWEAVLLPMFHIGPLPIKLLYVAVLWFFLRNRPTRGVRHVIVWIFASLAMLTIAGWLTYLRIAPTWAMSETLSMVVTYIVAAAAFSFGWHHRELVLRRTPPLVLVYVAANIFVIVLWPRLVHSPFGQLYGYGEDFLGPGTIMLRAGGLHFNPHVSALFLTLLLLYVYAGLRYRELQASRWQVSVAIAAALVLQIILASRSEILTSVLITLAMLWLILQRRTRMRWALQIGTAGVLVVFAGLIAHRILLSEVPLSLLLGRLTGTLGELASDPSNVQSGLGRPFRYWIWGIAPARLATSPLIGTGGETLGYHNDWLILLVSSGILGLILFLAYILIVIRIDPVYVLPFLIAGMTNAFLYAPQHFTLFMILLGATARLRRLKPMSAPMLLRPIPRFRNFPPQVHVAGQPTFLGSLESIRGLNSTGR